jgi:hypothetical protein
MRARESTLMVSVQTTLTGRCVRENARRFTETSATSGEHRRSRPPSRAGARALRAALRRWR